MKLGHHPRLNILDTAARLRYTWYTTDMPKTEKGEREPVTSVKVTHPVRKYIRDRAKWGESVDQTLRRLWGINGGQKRARA